MQKNEPALENKIFSDRDFSSMEKIYKDCFGIQTNNLFFCWKYQDNPSGTVKAFISKDNETAAAFYGMLPDTYTRNGQTFRVYQSMDTMTHPSYQKRGLFVKLSELTYKRIEEEEGSLFALGIAGSQSYHGFVQKLGWKHAGSFKLTFQVGMILLLKNLFHSFSHSVSDISDFDLLKINEYFNSRKINASYFQRAYSGDFFNWRVLKHPLKKYIVKVAHKNGSITGICVCENDSKGRIRIMFIDSINIESARNIYASLLYHLALKSPCKWFYTWQPIPIEKKKVFKKLGFLVNPFKRGLFSYQVPLILRASGKAQKDWENFSLFDLQPLNQD